MNTQKLEELIKKLSNLPETVAKEAVAILEDVKKEVQDLQELMRSK
jgi:recombinational DNA repair protein RecR